MDRDGTNGGSRARRRSPGARGFGQPASPPRGLWQEGYAGRRRSTAEFVHPGAGCPMGDESNKSVAVREGDVLAGRYRIDGILGAGGMGVVVAARHLQLDERVALKFLSPAAVHDPEAMARFAREARASVKIQSEHVARVRDVGTLENGAPYIVMEFLEGSDLGEWLCQKGPLPIDQAVEFVLQACEAVAEAHSFGIIHRDLKPANLFVVRRNDGRYSVKVLDFGISKMTKDTGDLAGTSTRHVMGSPHYMSPEQMHSSKNVTAQSDLWSIGVVLYELISGQTPFPGDTFPTVCVKVATEPPPPLRDVRPDVPAPLEAIILKCLEKDRGRRFQSVAELAVALRDFAPKRARASVERIVGILQHASGEDVGAAPHAPDAPRDSTIAGTMAPYARTTAGRSRRKTGVSAAAGVAGALAIALGVAVLHRGTVPRSDAAAPPPAEVVSVPYVRLAPSVAPTPLPPLPSVPMESLPLAASAGPAANPRADDDVAPTARRRVSTADCHLPFYFDADGIRVFKKECVH
jgi:hypothetical protein